MPELQKTSKKTTRWATQNDKSINAKRVAKVWSPPAAALLPLLRHDSVQALAPRLQKLSAHFCRQLHPLLRLHAQLSKPTRVRLKKFRTLGVGRLEVLPHWASTAIAPNPCLHYRMAP